MRAQTYTTGSVRRLKVGIAVDELGFRGRQSRRLAEHARRERHSGGARRGRDTNFPLPVPRGDACGEDESSGFLSRAFHRVCFARDAYGRSLLRASDVPGYARRAHARCGGSAYGCTASGRKSGGGAARDSRRVLVRWYRAVVPRQCRYKWCASGSGGVFKAKPWGNCAFVLDRTGKYAARVAAKARRGRGDRAALSLCFVPNAT